MSFCASPGYLYDRLAVRPVLCTGDLKKTLLIRSQLISFSDMVIINVYGILDFRTSFATSPGVCFMTQVAF